MASYCRRIRALERTVRELNARIDRLVRAMRGQASREKRLRKLLEESQEREKALQAQLEEAQREAQGQSSPFSKRNRKRNPKKPGRKPGAGTFRRREEPKPTEAPISVPVEKSRCECGGQLSHLHSERVTTTELPRAPKPEVRAYDVEVCRCDRCGRRVRGRHAEVAPDQYGATAHRLGPRARATAHTLHYGLGVTVRKTPAVLRALTGLEVTQGAITQDALRQMKGPVGKTYEALRDGVKDSDYVHTDDTGWKINGDPAQLMVFETTGSDPVTVFQIRRQHRNEEVREVIPGDYKGTMTTDRGRSYDAKELRDVRQNKCVVHVKRNVEKAQANQPPGARSFGNRILAAITSAVALWQAYHRGELKLADYWVHGDAILKELAWILQDRHLADPENQRLLKGLAKQNRLGHLLRFLEDPQVEPTNNRAERALRFSVILRTISQGSKSNEGAEAHATYQSVLRTLSRRGLNMIEGLSAILKGANPLARGSPRCS